MIQTGRSLRLLVAALHARHCLRLSIQGFKSGSDQGSRALLIWSEVTHSIPSFSRSRVAWTPASLHPLCGTNVSLKVELGPLAEGRVQVPGGDGGVKSVSKGPGSGVWALALEPGA